MKKLSQLHQQRFDAAKKLFQSLIETAKARDALIQHNDAILSHDKIVFREDGIDVQLGEATREIWFEADPDWNHGLHDSIKDFEAEVRKQFRLVKTIPW